MPLGSDDESTRAAVAARRAQQARPNDGIESSSFTPFAPASTALEALNNAEHGFTPDGDLLWSPAAPGQANELLSRAIGGESGVAVRLRTVRTTDVAIPVIIGSFEDAQGELDDCRCLPYNMLDDDLSADGLRPLPQGRFRGAKDPFAVTLLMLGCGWVRTAAQISYGKPGVDLGLALPLAKAKRAGEDLAKARALLDPFVPAPNAPATDEQIAIGAAAASIDKSRAMLNAATVDFDARLHDPARMKGGTVTPKGDVWALDETKNGTQVACSMTLDEAFQLWKDEKAKTAGTPGAGAGGFSETSPGGSGGGLKG